MSTDEGTTHPRRHLASALAEVERLTEQLAALEASRAALLPLARAVIRYHFHDSTDRAWVEVEAALDALDPAVRADLEATDGG